MPTWTDDEGRLRLRADDKHQFLCNVPLESLDPWTSYDSWSAELAIRLITIGYNLDIQRCWDEAIDYPYGSTGKDSAWAYVDVYERGMSIAQSSIAAGLLKNPDTPANWLAWAKCKGYDVAHLKHPQTSPATNTATPAREESESISANDTIDYASLASREQLIKAFGAFTGMDMTWFTSLNDVPALKRARKVSGQGGRGRTAEPFFCPYEVSQWLISPKRRKGTKLSADKGWEILEKKFLKVYNARSIGDTRTD